MPLISAHRLRNIIREELEQHFTWPGDVDPRPVPPEQEFYDGPDVLVGYIIVSEIHGNSIIASAPITKTDGPDRPFLVRTTDTRWHIPFWIVRLIYPSVQDVFNAVDSKEDWRTLGPGSTGHVGEFAWVWSDREPAVHGLPEGTIRLTHRQFCMLVEAEEKISAGAEYMRKFEDPMSAVQAHLRDYFSGLPRDKVMTMVPGSSEVMQEVERALDEIGVDDPAKRDLISRPMRMIPPAAFLPPAPKT